MPVSEVFWAIAFAFLALYAVFNTLICLFTILHPRGSMIWDVLLINTVIIAICSGLAYGIWESFLR